MTRISTISSLACQVLVRAAAAQQLDERDLCRRAGVDWQVLEDPESRVSISAYYSLLECLAEALGDPHLGLRLAEYAQPEDYGLLGFLFMNSANVGQAFERLLRYQRLVTDSLMTMEVHSGRAVVTCELWGPDRPAHAHMGDAFAAEAMMGFQMLCGYDVPQTFELHLMRPATDPTPYVERLGVYPQFSASQLRLGFDAEVLELPVQGADAGLSSMLERQAEIMMRLLPKSDSAQPSHAHRVREVVFEMLPNGIPKLAQVAKRLGQSSRSLQRHLREENTSLTLLIEDLRHVMSQEQLRQGSSTAEIALLLGFSEVSAFHRAFKRRTGLTPRQWREQESSRVRQDWHSVRII